MPKLTRTGVVAQHIGEYAVVGAYEGGIWCYEQQGSPRAAYARVHNGNVYGALWEGTITRAQDERAACHTLGRHVVGYVDKHGVRVDGQGPAPKSVVSVMTGEAIAFRR